MILSRKPRPVPAGRAAAGFTLIEAVIAMAVLGIGLMLAASLLVQAHRMLAQAGIRARTPPSAPVLDRLRSDIQGASAIDAGLGALPGWSRDRLTLVFPDGHRVRYEMDGSRLDRSELLPPPAGGGKAPKAASKDWTRPRPVLRDVYSWRWIVAGPRLLTVELTFRDADPRDPVLDPAGPIEPSLGWQTREVTAALRGGGLGWGW